MATQNKKKEKFSGWKRGVKKHVYHLKEGQAKRLRLKKIEFVGFKKIPVGFQLYASGGGFNRQQQNAFGAEHLILYLKQKFAKNFKLIIFSKSRRAQFKETAASIELRISSDEFKDLVKNLGNEIASEKALIITARLNKILPTNFKLSGGTQDTREILNEINLNALKKADHEAVGNFIRSYISFSSTNDQALENLHLNLVIQGRKKTLDQVIKKFERYTHDTSKSEKAWQKFLHTEVFHFISNYVESVREVDVNFGKEENGAKKPDFVWIDLYGFLDVFEIKTPQTQILGTGIDASHKNYYFSGSASKAISQIEKYILFLEGNASHFEKYLQRKTRVPFSVLKPKAFLIIGSNREFNGIDAKKKDFRVLRRSFKNIEFITFDELLDNLKSLSSKFEKEL